MALKAWRSFSRVIRERPIRLLSLVVLLLSLLLLHGVVAFLLFLALYGPEGWTVFAFPFLEIVGWSFVLLLLSLRLWGLGLGASAIRLARSVGRTVKERPAKLLAGVLLAVGIPYTFYLGLLLLFSLFVYGLSWDACSDIWGLLCLLAIPGIAAVLLGFHAWGEGRRPWAFFFVWFIAMRIMLMAAGVIWRSLTPPWSDAWLVHHRRGRLQAERDQRQETAPQESDESEVPGQSLEQWEPRTDVEEVDPRDD